MLSFNDVENRSNSELICLKFWGTIFCKLPIYSTVNFNQETLTHSAIFSSRCLFRSKRSFSCCSFAATSAACVSASASFRASSVNPDQMKNTVQIHEGDKRTETSFKYAHMKRNILEASWTQTAGLTSKDWMFSTPGDKKKLLYKHRMPKIHYPS